MPKHRLSRTKHRAMVRDVLEGRHDLASLAEAYSLTHGELAEWAAQRSVQRCLTGLCALADLQTQLMLSRFRQVAANKLIRQAGGEDGELSPEQSRKACVDLLRIELKRAEGPAGDERKVATERGGGASMSWQVASIRRAMRAGRADTDRRRLEVLP